jgi:hypothetical protein
LDTPNSIYEFLKFVFKSVKTNKEKQSKTRNSLNAPGYATQSDWRSSSTVNSVPRVNHPRQDRILTGENSLTARSSAVRSPPLASSRHPTSIGMVGWPSGSPELARRRPWQTMEVCGGGLAISGDDTRRRAWLRLQDVLPEI